MRQTKAHVEGVNFGTRALNLGLSLSASCSQKGNLVGNKVCTYIYGGLSAENTVHLRLLIHLPFGLRIFAGGAGGCSVYLEMTRGSQS